MVAGDEDHLELLWRSIRATSPNVSPEILTAQNRKKNKDQSEVRGYVGFSQDGFLNERKRARKKERRTLIG